MSVLVELGRLIQELGDLMSGTRKGKTETQRPRNKDINQLAVEAVFNAMERPKIKQLKI